MHDRSTGMAAFDETAPHGELYAGTETTADQLVREMAQISATDQQRILRFAIALVDGKWPVDLDTTKAMPLADFRGLCDQLPAPGGNSFFPCTKSAAAIAGRPVRLLHGRGASMRYEQMDSDRFLAHVIDMGDAVEYMGQSLRAETAGLPAWDNLVGPMVLDDGSVLYLDWFAAQDILPGVGEHFYDEALDTRILPALRAVEALASYPDRLFHVVDDAGGELKIDTYGASEFITSMAARGFVCGGPVHRPRLRYELQGMPVFDGLHGPMYSRTGIRYETTGAHGRLSS